MRSIFGFAFALLTATAAVAAPPVGPACQTFVSRHGDVLIFTSDSSATFARKGREAENCDTAYVGGEAGYEPSINVRCGPDLGAYILGDDATFHASYAQPALTFRGATFTRDCNKRH